MEILYKNDYLKELDDVSSFGRDSFIASITYDLKKPEFGEIWVCRVPVLLCDNGVVSFETISRPVLVIDDGHEYFVKHDNRNYYVLKITSQKDSYHREKIVNSKEIGLQKTSFVRIEVPIKVEKEQFMYLVGTLDKGVTLKYLRKVQIFLQNKENTCSTSKNLIQ